MTPDRRRQIESLCLEALTRDPDSRAAFLDEACAGDVELRREVDSLLAGQPGAAGFLEKPAWQEGSTPLTPGTRLGPYEIDAAIGAGGMGEVYKARDTRLGRTVAVKVLPAGVASDPERRRRFEQEARAASALNHPHICALFDIGESIPAGPEPLAHGLRPLAPVSYLVMEHLDGQTLHARLTKGKLPVAQALDIGIQIADALSAAHKHGIVHRDLTPGNIMLVKGDGGAALQIKLLDFGLAKLRPSATTLEGSAAPTVTAPGTSVGMVVGTVPYMAPEQIEGKVTDTRTDLFAFGTVLYEMLSGTRAFGGDSSAAVMAAILEREPRPLGEIAPLTPPALARLVKRCLAKDPDARWDSAHDIADELRWLREAGDAADELRWVRDAGTTVTGTAEQPRRRRTLRTARALAGLLATAVIVAGAMWLLRPSPPVTGILRAALPVRPAEEVNAGGVVEAGILTPGGSRTALTLTPDGRALVFVGRRNGVQQLYVRWLDAAEAVPLKGTEGAQVPAVSTDGRQVAFWAGEAIKKVALDGGVAADLMLHVRTPPSGLAWDARGRLFFGRYDDFRIWTIPPEGTPAAVTTVGEGERAHTLPSLLPGGRVLLYTVRKRYWSWGDEEVVAQTLATGERTVVLRNATDARYVPSGHLAFMRWGVLYAVPFDPARLKPVGPEVPVLDGVAHALTASFNDDVTGAGQFAIAPTGTLAYLSGPLVPPEQGRLVTLDRRGRVTPLPAPERSYGARLRVSPDQRQLAVIVRTPTEVGLWVYNLTRPAPLVRLTAEGEATAGAVWGPGGQSLVFQWVKNGRRGLVMQPTDGSTPPRTLVSGRVWPSSLGPDGRIAAVAEGTASRDDRDIMAVVIENGKARLEPLIQTPYIEQWPEFSPDGHWLLYGSDVSGRFEVYVRPYPGPGGAEPVSVKGGESPAWNPSGREILFVSLADGSGSRRMMTAAFTPGSPPRIGHPTELFSFDPRGLFMLCIPVRCYDVASDGQRFYVVQTPIGPSRPVVTYINLIQNWFEELKAKVPLK